MPRYSFSFHAVFSRPRALITAIVTLLFAAFEVQALAPEKLEEVSRDQQWLQLLHYHQTGFFPAFESQADDQEFFFASDGNTNPLSELVATINAFNNPSSDGNSARCKFPARRHWIENKLQLVFPESNCDEFEKWFEKIDAGGITLIFPAAYLNSPSSMFGHTLFRIDRKSGGNALLDYSVNYAANADPDDNELVFSYKGLSGGYPGVFSILPYYQKVKEYSFLESRDVWEYSVDINADEIAQFLRHVWEIKSTHFDYYFFTENCSYHLLTLLDAASPRFNLTQNFRLHAIPSDTVKVMETAGLLKDPIFRPSIQSQMEHMRKEMSAEERAIAKSLVEDDLDIKASLSSYSPDKQAQILELAYQYARYLSVRKKQISKQANQRAIALLSARSKVSTVEAFAAFPTPAFRDDQGHGSQRIDLGYGYESKQHFFDAGLRMAYHDHLDPIPGFIKGAQLEMFHLRLRQYVDSSKGPRLQSLKFIDIASLSPRNELLTPTSWRVSTGLKRHDYQPGELAPYLEGGAGRSWLWEQHQFSLLLSTEINADNDYNKGFAANAGPEISWLIQLPDWSLKVSSKRYFHLAGADFGGFDASVELGINLYRDWQIAFQARYRHADHEHGDFFDEDSAASTSLRYYF